MPSMKTPHKPRHYSFDQEKSRHDPASPTLHRLPVPQLYVLLGTIVFFSIFLPRNPRPVSPGVTANATSDQVFKAAGQELGFFLPLKSNTERSVALKSRTNLSMTGNVSCGKWRQLKAAPTGLLPLFTFTDVRREAQCVTAALERFEQLYGCEDTAALKVRSLVGSPFTVHSQSLAFLVTHHNLTVHTRLSSSDVLGYALLSNRVLLTRRDINGIVQRTSFVSAPMAFFSVKSSEWNAVERNCRDQHEIWRTVKSAMSWLTGVDSVLVSDIVVVSVPACQSRPTFLTDGMMLILGHTAPVQRADSTQCVFWDKRSHQWSGWGCRKVQSNASHTRCHCNHLSSFALIMNVGIHNNTTGSLPQQVLTYILLPLSIVGLALTITTFSYFKRLYSQRTFIHINMMSCLMVSQILFLFGMHVTVQNHFCQAVAIVMHYTFLCAFCLMLLEGFQVVIMLTQPNSNLASSRPRVSSGKHTRLSLLLAYFFPLVIVVISMSVHIDDYGSKLHCWLSNDHWMVWSFVGPVLGVISVNTILFVVANYVMCIHSRTSNAMTNRRLTQKLWVWIRGDIILLIVLGVPYVFGVFNLGPQYVVFAYIFLLLNATQGILIFLFYCILDDKIQDEYRRTFFPYLRALEDRLPFNFPCDLKVKREVDEDIKYPQKTRRRSRFSEFEDLLTRRDVADCDVSEEHGSFGRLFSLFLKWDSREPTQSLSCAPESVVERSEAGNVLQLISSACIENSELTKYQDSPCSFSRTPKLNYLKKTSVTSSQVDENIAQDTRVNRKTGMMLTFSLCSKRDSDKRQRRDSDGHKADSSKLLTRAFSCVFRKPLKQKSFSRALSPITSVSDESPNTENGKDKKGSQLPQSTTQTTDTLSAAQLAVQLDLNTRNDIPSQHRLQDPGVELQATQSLETTDETRKAEVATSRKTSRKEKSKRRTMKLISIFTVDESRQNEAGTSGTETSADGVCEVDLPDLSIHDEGTESKLSNE